MEKITLEKISRPDFGLPDSEPPIRKREYQNRLISARRRIQSLDLDFLIVYGDREHSANLAFLTGFDPRFEEALLILPASDKTAILIVGNEGMGYSRISPLQIQRRLYQGFSLPGQPRETSGRLAPVLRDCGLKSGKRLGVAGWKQPEVTAAPGQNTWLDIPSFIADTLRKIAGRENRVVNATSIFNDPADGLRTFNSPDQLAAFEFGASHCSRAVSDILGNLRPGRTEREAALALKLGGVPLPVHAMLSSGPRVALGMASPSDREMKANDPFLTAIGLCGGLTARGGLLSAWKTGANREANRTYLKRVLQPYYAAVAAWYETLGLGITGGKLQSAVDQALAGTGLKLALNPGHLIHLDEWLNSPVFPDSRLTFQSGMLVQCDLIPVVPAGHPTANAEDTVALADAGLRRKLAKAHPGLWNRVTARRRFMEEVLNIRLKPEVLPFSNLAGLVQPFILDPDLALVIR